MFGVPDLESIAAKQKSCRQRRAQSHPVEPQRNVWSARSGIDGSKTEPMKTRVVNNGPRVIPLSSNGIVGVPDLESIAGPRIMGVPDLESIAAKQNP